MRGRRRRRGGSQTRHGLAHRIHLGAGLLQLLRDGRHLLGKLRHPLGGGLLPGNGRKHLLFELTQPSRLRLLPGDSGFQLALQRRQTIIHPLLERFHGRSCFLNALHRVTDLLRDLRKTLRDVALFRDGRVQPVLHLGQALHGLTAARRAAQALGADVDQPDRQHDDRRPLPAALRIGFRHARILNAWGWAGAPCPGPRVGSGARQRPANQLTGQGAGVLVVAHEHLAIHHRRLDAGRLLLQATRPGGQVVRHLRQ